MIETPPVPDIFLNEPGIRVPAPSAEQQFVFISDLHLDPNNRNHIPLARALFNAYPHDITVFGGDEVNLDVIKLGHSHLLPVLAELAGDTIGRTVILDGNHDPKKKLRGALKSDEGGADVYSYAYSDISTSERDHHLLFTHGDSKDFLHYLADYPVMRRTFSPFMELTRKWIHEDPLQAKILTSLPSLSQKRKFKKILPPHTTAVVGHTHYPRVEDFDNDRRLITSGSGYIDTLNGHNGVFKFNLVRLLGNGPIFEDYQFNEKTDQIEFLNRLELNK